METVYIVAVALYLIASVAMSLHTKPMVPPDITISPSYTLKNIDACYDLSNDDNNYKKTDAERVKAYDDCLKELE